MRHAHGETIGLGLHVPRARAYSTFIGIFVVVGAITYFSLITGELVPKRVALSNPEGRAMLIAKPMTGLSRFAAPAVWFLTIFTNLVLKVFGLGKDVEAPPSEEEISNLIEQGTDERAVTEIMTRRTKIVWLNVADTEEVNWRKIVTSGHSHFPVYEGTRDHVIGMVSVESLWANAAAGVPNSIRNHLTQPLVVPQTVHVVQLLESSPT